MIVEEHVDVQAALLGGHDGAVALGAVFALKLKQRVHGGDDGMSCDGDATFGHSAGLEQAGAVGEGLIVLRRGKHGGGDGKGEQRDHGEHDEQHGAVLAECTRADDHVGAWQNRHTDAR